MKQLIINNCCPVIATKLSNLLKNEMIQCLRVIKIILQMRVVTSLEIIPIQTVRTVFRRNVNHVIPVIINHPYFHRTSQHGQPAIVQHIFQHHRVHGISNHVQLGLPVTVLPENNPTAGKQILNLHRCRIPIFHCIQRIRHLKIQRVGLRWQTYGKDQITLIPKRVFCKIDSIRPGHPLEFQM